MNIPQRLRRIWLTIGMVFLAAPALAATAYSNEDLNLRVGPGRQFSRIGIIEAGARMDLRGCIDGYSWCEVTIEGDRGWVSGRTLLVRSERRRWVPCGNDFGPPIKIIRYRSERYDDRYDDWSNGGSRGRGLWPDDRGPDDRDNRDRDWHKPYWTDSWGRR